MIYIGNNVSGIKAAHLAWQQAVNVSGHPPYSAALTSHANVGPHPAIIKILADALKLVSLPLLYARPILELLLTSTSAILVERLMVTSVAVV